MPRRFDWNGGGCMNHLLTEAITLMLVGMGTVYVFLILLVFATGLMSRLITRYVPEPPPPHSQIENVIPQNQDQQQLLAVITAAIHQYRSRHK